MAEQSSAADSSTGVQNSSIWVFVKVLDTYLQGLLMTRHFLPLLLSPSGIYVPSEGQSNL